MSESLINILSNFIRRDYICHLHNFLVFITYWRTVDRNDFFLRAEISPYIFGETLLKETGTFGQCGYNWWSVCYRTLLPRKNSSSLSPNKSNILNNTIALRFHIIKELMSKTGLASIREQSLTGEAPWG